MIVRPIQDRVVLKRIEDPPERVVLTDQGPSLRCEVIAVGPGKWVGKTFHPTEVKAGQIVRIGPYVDLELDGIVICQEADIRFVEDEKR